ncbi:hypothetical protein FP744_10003660 [Trichoderma asperellum]
MTQKSIEISQSRLDKKTHIEELISLIEANKLSEQNDKPLKIPIGNREVVVRDYIANTVAFITKVGDIAFSFTPVEASAPWAIAKAALQIPVHQIEQKAALLGTVKWFISIVRRGQIYETSYTVETTDRKAVQGLQDGLLQVYVAAIKTLAKSGSLFNSSTARQTLTAILDPGYASDALKDLVEKENKLDREIYACEVSRSVVSSTLMSAILTKLMGKSENPIKIFMSSRPDREYLEAFEDEAIITVNASSQQEDIERFLAEKLYTTRFFQQRSHVIQNEITNVFAAQSCGMFRWVYLQVMSLKKLIEDRAIYNWACNLPVDLMAAYDQIWETIKEHDEHDVALAERAIMWVLCSFEPLKAQVLLQAIRYVIQGSAIVRNEGRRNNRSYRYAKTF